MVVNTIRLAALQLSINKPIFSVCSCKTQVTREKSIPPLEVRFGTVKGNSFFNIIEEKIKLK